jgi:sterol 14-demethylase
VGSVIAINAGLLHRHPSVWSDPCKFDPSRLSPERNELANGVFMGFGAGAHPCVGRKFAVTAIMLFVVEAFKSFDFELEQVETSEEDPLTKRMINNVPNHPKLDKSQKISIWRPAEPVYVNFRRRKS